MPKPRKPIRDLHEMVDGHFLVDEVVSPTGWRSKQAFAAYDRKWGMRGAWLEALLTTFDESWLVEQKDVAHVVARCMYWSWEPSLRKLADVADLVLAVREAQSGDASILKRMRVHEEFLGASFEARVARLLLEGGHPFRFESAATADSKGFDLAVNGAAPFNIEVKSKQKWSVADQEEGLASWISMLLFPERLGWDLSFRWDRESLRRFLREQSAEGRERLVSASVRAIRTSLASGEGDRRSASLDGVGTVTLARLEPGSDVASMQTVCDLSEGPNDEAARLAKVVGEASQQLPSDRPGVVFTCAEPDVADRELAVAAVEDMLVHDGAQYPQVAGVVVFFSTDGLDAIVEETWPCRNPHSPFAFDELGFEPCMEPLQRRRWPEQEPAGEPR